MAVLLDLDEGADLRSVTDRTPVQIHEIGVGEDRLGTKLNVPERHCPEHPCLLALSQSGNRGKTKVQSKPGVHAVPLDSPSGGRSHYRSLGVSTGGSNVNYGGSVTGAQVGHRATVGAQAAIIRDPAQDHEPRRRPSSHAAGAGTAPPRRQVGRPPAVPRHRRLPALPRRTPPAGRAASTPPARPACALASWPRGVPWPARRYRVAGGLAAQMRCGGDA